MANVFATPTLFTKLTLMNLGGYLNVAKNMSRDYSSKFGKEDKETHKPGDTIFVPKPQRFQVTDGLGYSGQPIENTQTPITVDQIKGVHFQWDSVERTMSLTELDEMWAKPAALALASTINNLAATYITKRTAYQVGTPGTTPTSMLTYLSAADKLISVGLPEQEELVAVISRKMGSTYIASQSTSFNPAGMIGGQTMKGAINENQLGYKWFTDQTLYRHTGGTYSGTPLTNGVGGQSADGGDNAEMTLITDGWGSGVTTLNEGDVFTVSGVYAVHPQTRVSTGDLKQFVVRATISDTSGAISALISPAITPTGQYQNVTNSAADNHAIVISAASATVSEQGLIMHRNAFAFASVPLKNPESGKGVEFAREETDPETGLSLSFIRYFDGDARVHKNRFDCLFGFGSLYREMACRVASA